MSKYVIITSALLFFYGSPGLQIYISAAVMTPIRNIFRIHEWRSKNRLIENRYELDGTINAKKTADKK